MGNIIFTIIILLLPCLLSGSGGYDNGTATGKGKFQLDLTWNPFDKFDFGQSYAIMSYGITKRLDVHGYISKHPEGYQTWYGGLFYQLLAMKRLHLATAVGIRRQFNDDWTHLFAPQLLYSILITEKLSLGGSFVDVRQLSSGIRYGATVDLGLFYDLSVDTNWIEKISIGIGAFHPATWEPNSFFLPTYSVGFKFK